MSEHCVSLSPRANAVRVPGGVRPVPLLALPPLSASEVAALHGVATEVSQDEDEYLPLRKAVDQITQFNTAALRQVYWTNTNNAARAAFQRIATIAIGAIAAIDEAEAVQAGRME